MNIGYFKGMNNRLDTLFSLIEYKHSKIHISDLLVHKNMKK